MKARVLAVAVARAVALGLALLAASCGDDRGATSAPDAGSGADAPAASGAVRCADPAPAPATTTDVGVFLRGVPGVTDVVEGTSSVSGYRFYTLTLRQLVDHSVAGGATFRQRLSVMHAGRSAPVVLGTRGYALPQRPFREEPTALLDANQVEVEHRYFAPSVPDPVDWSKLTIWQAAADHHCVVTAFRAFYGGAWVNTGQSKGGMAAVYHRRFFPDDVAGTAAYVAPLSFAGPDPRYVAAVETGTHPECRQRLKDLQRLVLGRRADLEALMTASATTFERLGVDVAFEHVILELPFGFWQYGTADGCAAIPDATATTAALYAYLEDVGDLALYGDAQVDYYGPYYVQSGNQLGWPQIGEQSVADLLRHPGTDRPSTYVPRGVVTAYGPGAMQDVDGWVRSQGKRLLFIYGQNDPWSAGMFELGGATDSFRFVVAEGNHGSLLRQLAGPDQATALDALGRWAGAPAHLSARKPGDEAPEPPRMPR